MLDDAIRVLITELRTKAVDLATSVPKSDILLRLVIQDDGHPFPGRLFSKDHEWWALPGDYVCDVAGVPFPAGVRDCSLSLARSCTSRSDDYQEFLEVADKAGRLLAHVQGGGRGDVATWCQHLAMQQITRLHWRTDREPGIAGSDSQVCDIADVLNLTAAALAEMLKQPAKKDDAEPPPLAGEGGLAKAGGNWWRVEPPPAHWHQECLIGTQKWLCEQLGCDEDTFIGQCRDDNPRYWAMKGHRTNYQLYFRHEASFRSAKPQSGNVQIRPKPTKTDQNR